MSPPGAPVHLVGHSTGGRDAGLFARPGVALDGGLPIEPLAQRVHSVVTVATPHRGTPLATFFSSRMGQHALRLLSLATITVLRRGRLPVALMARVTGTMVRLAVGRTSAPADLLDHLEGELPGTLPHDQPD